METITSRHHHLAALTRLLYRDRNTRQENRLFVGEGFKLYREAIQSGAEITAVLVRNDMKNDPRIAELPDGISYFVEEKLYNSLCDVKTPQGILFHCRMRNYKMNEKLQNCLILDELQDPGNLGTICRTADAFGISALLITNGSVDLYNPKTVRATMGAIFRIPVWYADKEQILKLCAQNELPVYAADLAENSVRLTSADVHHAAVVIGNEGNGVSDFFKEKAEKSIIIPMRPHTESLNASVAASIIAWEMTK